MGTAANKVESFYELLRSGIQGTDVTGICQFFLDGADSTRFYIKIFDGSISYGFGEHQNPTTTITMPEALFASIVARPHLWDLRNPEVVASVFVAGDVDMALFLGMIVKTPARTGMAVFKEAEIKTRGQALQATDIERLSEPSRQDVIDRLDRGIPFFITDCLRGVGAWAWRFEEIESTFAHLNVDAVDNVTKAPKTLGDFFQDMELGRQSYTHGIPLPVAMRPYFKLPIFPDQAFNTPLLWMGRKNGTSGAEPCTSLHRDTSHGFLGQIKGTKRIVLCSPDQARKVYPEPTYNVFQSCQIKIWQPDYVRFPLSKDLRSIELTLHPAELLVIPAGWFHEVYSSEPVMSVGMFMNWNYWKSLFPSKGETS